MLSLKNLKIIRNLHLSIPLLIFTLLITQAGCVPAPEDTTVSVGNVVVELDSIKVLDEADGPGNAEPYIWPVFFKVDGKTIDLFLSPPSTDPEVIAANHSNYIFAPNGNHKNLGTNDGDYWDKDDNIPIPSSIGKFEANLHSHEHMTSDDITVGVLIVLLEEDAFPSSDSIRDEHYPEFVKKVTKRIDDTITEKITEKIIEKINESEGKSGSVSEVVTSVEEEIMEELTTKLSEPWYAHLIPGLPGAIDIDDFIGAKLFVFSFSELEAQPDQDFSVVWDDRTGTEDGDFQLFGSIRLEK